MLFWSQDVILDWGRYQAIQFVVFSSRSFLILFLSNFRFNMALYCNLKLNMYVVAACLNTNSEGAQKLLEQCDPKSFLLVELDIRKSASILHIEKTMINLLARDNNLGK